MASSTTSSSSKSEFLVNEKYRLIRKIGSGSFGDIYLGINVSNGEVWQFMYSVILPLAVSSDVRKLKLDTS